MDYEECFPSCFLMKEESTPPWYLHCSSGKSLFFSGYELLISWCWKVHHPKSQYFTENALPNLSCQSNSIHWEGERAQGDTKCINVHMTKNCENRFIFLSHFSVLQAVLHSGYWLLQGSSLGIQLFSYLVQETTQKKDVTIRSANSTFRLNAKSYLRTWKWKYLSHRVTENL